MYLGRDTHAAIKNDFHSARSASLDRFFACHFVRWLGFDAAQTTETALERYHVIIGVIIDIEWSVHGLSFFVCIASALAAATDTTYHATQMHNWFSQLVRILYLVILLMGCTLVIAVRWLFPRAMWPWSVRLAWEQKKPNQENPL